ncbi:hypothetical protein GDO81_008952 [Engystomops pustulosus]|uniref:Olfactory receptor n=1 Tax=Engystomops pustulosus TaxID=76066 RepID=A0AAV7BMN2_ENGPU|nr:hypothetical protein GDO81_008952 [Engystomops pustulosus]
MTLVSNSAISTLVSTSRQLHSPMYFFLGHLAATDLLIALFITPYMLHVVLKEGATISLGPCIIQLFLFCVSETVECFILTVMSYDRYLAICDPLRYSSIMSARFQYQLMFWSWFLGTMTSIILAAQIYVLQYCGSNIIDHFFCDPIALLELSCSSTYIVKLEDLIISVSVTLFPFAFICLTYFCIFFTIFRRPAHVEKHKAFSTCTSHLLVVSLFYGSLLSVYGAPSRNYSPSLNKGLSLLYTFMTPLFNPIIYSLRSQELSWTPDFSSTFTFLPPAGPCTLHGTATTTQQEESLLNPILYVDKNISIPISINITHPPDENLSCSLLASMQPSGTPRRCRNGLTTTQQA